MGPLCKTCYTVAVDSFGHDGNPGEVIERVNIIDDASKLFNVAVKYMHHPELVPFFQSIVRRQQTSYTKSFKLKLAVTPAEYLDRYYVLFRFYVFVYFCLLCLLMFKQITTNV